MDESNVVSKSKAAAKPKKKGKASKAKKPAAKQQQQPVAVAEAPPEDATKERRAVQQEQAAMQEAAVSSGPAVDEQAACPALPAAAAAPVAGDAAAEVGLVSSSQGVEAAAPGLAEDASSHCPASPQWKVVLAKASKQKVASRAAASPAGTVAIRRNGSSSSLTSTSSWESHDTDLSRHDGSEKSVLRLHFGAGRVLVVPAPSHHAEAKGHAAGSVAKAAAAPAAAPPPVVAPVVVSRPQPAKPAAEDVAPNVLPEDAFPPLAGTAACSDSNPAVGASSVGSSSLPVSTLSSEPVTPPAASSSRAGDAVLLAQEVAALKNEVAFLQAQLQLQQLHHRDELAAVLEEAGVQQVEAIRQEREANIVKFTLFLQNNATLLSALPDLLASTTPAAACGSTPSFLDTLPLFADAGPSLAVAAELEATQAAVGPAAAEPGAAAFASLGFPPVITSRSLAFKPLTAAAAFAGLGKRGSHPSACCPKTVGK